MGRLIGPDEASREVKAIVGGIFRSKGGRPAQLWADAAATVPADVLTLAGTAIPASTVTIDSSSMLPLVQYPPGDVDVVYGTCDGGPAWPIYARTDDRLDALGGRVGTVEGVAAAAETPAGAQAKASAAQVAAQAASAQRAANLSDLADAATARTNLGAAQRGRLAQSMLTPVVIAGDSISSTGYGGVVYAAALGGHPSGTSAAGALSSQAGVAGNTSTQLLARFNTDVIAKSPSLVHILIGTNDAGNSVPVSTFAANIRSMVAQCAAIGARVVLGTVPPTSAPTPTNRKAYVIAYNQWLCRYALSQGIQVADYYGALVDPVAGGYQSAYDSGDGVHPTPAGISVMVSELAASITRPPSPALLLAKDDPDPWNYVRNGLFLSSWATGWTRIDASTGVTLSTPSDSAIRGNWGKIAAVASSGTAILNQNRTTSQGGTAYVVGNWTMLGARVQSSALSASQYWVVKNKFVTPATMYLGSAQNKFCASPSGGVVLLQDSAAPVASTSNSSEVNLAAGSGDVSVAQVTVYDLTAMGVTDSSGNLV